ncbi:hypothetical protein OIDMADRAFT_52656 [Oidiodendron maius Zn]|uniref:Uncharacterized protein n=1 Tax=Oidiodendron maius (strain Zn) TaxID=913774 RepID=A0A0C3CV06_OIDMZ|nr:hypothetical protein OIDMADRAFT_52656 [Oidiodendron maius Zn]
MKGSQMKGHAFQVPTRTLECINIRRLGHLWTDQTPCSVPGSSLAHGAGSHKDAQGVRYCPAIAGKLQNLENIGDEDFRGVANPVWGPNQKHPKPALNVTVGLAGTSSAVMGILL